MDPSMDSEAIEAVAARWFAKRHGDDWAQSDQAQFDQWLQQSTAHRIAFIRLDAAWQSSRRLQALGAGVPAGVIPPRHSWGDKFFLSRRRLLAEAGRVAVSARLRPSIPAWVTSSRALAAGLVLALGLVLVAALGWQRWPDDRLVYQTPVGAINTVPLEDGSRATLSTDSLIRVALESKERRVELDKGEVFFDVAKDPARPFVVQVGDQRVVAVGTKFSVRRNAEGIRVVVAEGLVRLERDGAKDAELPAGAVARTAGADVMVHEQATREVEQLLSWRTGHIMFRDTALAEAVAEFNRYNARKIVIADPAIADIRIGGSFRSDNVPAFLWLLQNGFPVAVEQRDDRVVLSAR
jgi:transmembrane sensor